MSYPGTEIFHIPPSPSALPVSAPTGTGSQTNLTKMSFCSIPTFSQQDNTEKKFFSNFYNPLQTK